MQTRTRQLMMFGLVALAVGFAGVQFFMTKRLWDDVAQLFTAAEATAPQSMRCGMLGTTRSVACTMEADDQTLELLIRRHGLTHTVSREAMPPEFRDALEACRLGDSTELDLWLSERRPDSLRLSDKTAFEYLLLMRGPMSPNALCLATSYSYG